MIDQFEFNFPFPTDHAISLAASIPIRLSNLAREVMDFWLPAGLDTDHGGFHGFLDRQGRPGAPEEKGVIQQARHLFALATWFERREQTDAVAKAARSTYQLLVNQMRDPEDGEYVYTIERTGAVKDSSKILYAQGFAIYGLSQYGRVFQNNEALEHALACFHAIDKRAHEPVYGGYDEINEPSWLTKGGRKETNTHIHLMEPFTTLFEATASPQVKERLKELVTLISTRLYQPSGYVHQQFHLDWAPMGNPAVSYGHDLETAWLLIEAERVLGEKDPQVLAAITGMGVSASAEGFDNKQGGYFDHGIPKKKVVGKEKVWWAQFEALAGLWWIYRMTNDTVHLKRLIKTLDWIEGPAKDHEFGEWYWGVMPAGTVGPRGDHKGELWKTTYHNLRALVFTEDWIHQWLKKVALG